ncbi:protein of unknown function [Pararobbsia alpina]
MNREFSRALNCASSHAMNRALSRALSRVLSRYVSHVAMPALNLALRAEGLIEMKEVTV